MRKNYFKTSGEKLPVVQPITTNLIPEVVVDRQDLMKTRETTMKVYDVVCD